MESMNRRLDSFLASQKKLEEKTQRFSKKSYVKLRTERVLLKRRPKNEDVRPKTPWTKTKTLWTKTKTPGTKTKTLWTKTKTSWTKTKTLWTKTKTPWTLKTGETK